MPESDDVQSRLDEIADLHARSKALSVERYMTIRKRSQAIRAAAAAGIKDGDIGERLGLCHQRIAQMRKDMKE